MWVLPKMCSSHEQCGGSLSKPQFRGWDKAAAGEAGKDSNKADPGPSGLTLLVVQLHKTGRCRDVNTRNQEGNRYNPVSDSCSSYAGGEEGPIGEVTHEEAILEGALGAGGHRGEQLGLLYDASRQLWTQDTPSQHTRRGDGTDPSAAPTCPANHWALSSPPPWLLFSLLLLPGHGIKPSSLSF